MRESSQSESESEQAASPASRGAPERSLRERGGEERAEARFLGLGPLNLVVLVLAVVAISIGYVLLSRGSVTAAPLLLVLGYAVLIPTALLIGFRRIKP